MKKKDYSMKANGPGQDNSSKDHPYKIDIDTLQKINIISDKDIKEAMILINEMYTHMTKRIGLPNFETNQLGRWGSEGGFSVSFSLNFIPYEQYGYALLNEPKVVSVSIITELLPRADMGIDLQTFGTFEAFLNQLKNWHAFEMSLPFSDKTSYFYNEDGITTERRKVEDNYSHPHD